MKDRNLPHLWTWEDDDARRAERTIDAQMDAPRSGTPVLSFAGEHGFLSNFHSSPVRIAGSTWPTVEHVYQGAKARDIDCMKKVLCAASPADAKRLGGRLTMRKGFEGIKDAVMLKAVTLKFRQNPELADRLIGTGNSLLEEGNDWGDRYWGVVNGSGRNRLGLILMTVRERLQCSKVYSPGAERRGSGVQGHAG